MKKFYASLICMSLAVFCLAQPSVHCDSVIQTSTCAGGNVIVPFTVSGGNFTFGNVFKAQLSNWLGSFANPVNIGQITWFTSGFIFATIPINTNFSVFYRIRVIASNPMDTSNASPNTVIITTIAQLNTILASPNQKYICPGDSLTLTAVNIANAYSWSTGATTQSIVVNGPGIYKVTTTDAFTCQSTTADTIYTSCTGIIENTLASSLGIFPNPSKGKFFICLNTEKMSDALVSISNVIGQEVDREQLSLGMNTKKNIDINGITPGIYFVTVTIGTDRVTKKMIIQ